MLPLSTVMKVRRWSCSQWRNVHTKSRWNRAYNLMGLLFFFFVLELEVVVKSQYFSFGYFCPSWLNRNLCSMCTFNRFFPLFWFFLICLLVVSVIHPFFPSLLFLKFAKFLARHVALQHLRSNSVFLFIHFGCWAISLSPCDRMTLQSAPRKMGVEHWMKLPTSFVLQNTLLLFMKLTELNDSTNSVRRSDYCVWWLGKLGDFS